MQAAAGGENKLIERARTGDRDAYEAVLRPVLPGALRLARALLGGPNEAEDAVQEAAVKGWLKLGNLRERAAFEPWFLGIVVREVRSLQRGRWWSLIRLPEIRSAPSVPEGDWLAANGVRTAVARLPRRQREAILLHFYLDLSIEAGAATLGLSAAGFKSRVNRGLRQLRKDIQ